MEQAASGASALGLGLIGARALHAVSSLWRRPHACLPPPLHLANLQPSTAYLTSQ